jgi:hypothetical protein
MSAFVALVLLAQVVIHRSGPGNDAAIRAFKEACIEGSLSLSPERGRVLENREITEFVDVLVWGRARSRTVVKLTDAPHSYIVLGEYKDLQPKSIARSCALVSGDISKEQAAAAYLEGIPDSEALPLWWPNVRIPQWTSDHPELGYRKTLKFRTDGSIVLEVGMYPTAAAEMKAGTTHQ